MGHSFNFEIGSQSLIMPDLAQIELIYKLSTAGSNLTYTYNLLTNYLGLGEKN